MQGRKKNFSSNQQPMPLKRQTIVAIELFLLFTYNMQSSINNIFYHAKYACHQVMIIRMFSPREKRKLIKFVYICAIYQVYLLFYCLKSRKYVIFFHFIQMMSLMSLWLHHWPFLLHRETFFCYCWYFKLP